MSKPAKPSKIKVAKKGTSAKEIKAWLRGIQEFQPADWTPSVEQWNAIREKIYSLDEVAPSAQAPNVYNERPVRYAQDDDNYVPPRPFKESQTFVASQPMGGTESPLAQPAAGGGTAIMKTLPGDGGVSVISDPEADGYKSPF